MVLLSTLAITTASIAAVTASPWKRSSKHATHGVRQVSNSDYVETYHPENTYKTFGKGVASPLKKRGEEGTLEENAAAFIEQELNIGGNNYRIRSSAPTETGGSVWIQEMVNGIPVANSVANVAFNAANDVVAFGTNFQSTESAFGGGPSVAPATPAITVADAVRSAEKTLSGTHNGHNPSLEYYVESSGSLVLTYVVQVVTPDGQHWYEAFVDASNGNVIGSNDFSASASYYAVDPTVQDITEGYSMFSRGDDWHAVGGNFTTDTSGNNVVAFIGDVTNTTKQSSEGLVFNYTYDLTLPPNVGQNVDAARVNAFYISNLIHDINYLYGFTEKTFNFQNDNFDKGGAGNDRILLSVQDSSGVNNANFNTPPDGTSGRMRMYIWTKSNPRRDGDLSNDVIAHEQTHGTTNRMTGGGTARCLQTTESRGMGEGWSDAFASWMEHKDSSVPDFALAKWVYNSPNGLRNYPYSTNLMTNPLTLARHVWANMLHNVYAGLVAQAGWAADAFTNPDGKSGNVVFLRLFMDALLLQPCNPTFVQARDAWIQADQNRYNGTHVCTIWISFSRLGLGPKAANYVDDVIIPEACNGDSPTSTTVATPTETATSTSEETTLQQSSTPIETSSTAGETTTTATESA
ncbi:hypothetical protein FRC19_000749 [Serendipita sp. 401]|nr:hypothetical protein FRC19_000749 [Serendipita sp. 401]